jgi:transcription initiation factor TFIIIB Brf1 subunit/transcription initiation factor TFIIB
MMERLRTWDLRIKATYDWNLISALNQLQTTSLARHDIGRQNIDASGRIIDAATRCMMERLRTWDLRIKATYDWNLISALNQLQTSKVRLGLSAVIVEKTTYIYRKAHKKGLVRGRYLLY